VRLKADFNHRVVPAFKAAGIGMEDLHVLYAFICISSGFPRLLGFNSNFIYTKLSVVLVSVDFSLTRKVYATKL